MSELSLSVRIPYEFRRLRKKITFSVSVSLPMPSIRSNRIEFFFRSSSVQGGISNGATERQCGHGFRKRFTDSDKRKRNAGNQTFVRSFRRWNWTLRVAWLFERWSLTALPVQSVVQSMSMSMSIVNLDIAESRNIFTALSVFNDSQIIPPFKLVSLQAHGNHFFKFYHM